MQVPREHPQPVHQPINPPGTSLLTGRKPLSPAASKHLEPAERPQLHSKLKAPRGFTGASAGLFGQDYRGM